jgi:hypothetical protein
MPNASMLIAMLAAAAALLLLLLPPHLLDTCQSFPSPMFPSFNRATELSLNAVLSAVFFGVLCIDRSHRALQALGCGITWSFTQWIVVLVLKQLLHDTACSRHANSVSGHVAFYLFVLMALRDCASEARGSCRSWWPVLLRLQLVLTCMLLCNTYMGGFHSLRQMLFGYILFALSFALYAPASSWMRARPLRCTIASACAFAVVAGVAVSIPDEDILPRMRRFFVYPAPAHTHVHTYTHAHTHTRTHAHAHTHTRTHTQTRTHTHTQLQLSQPHAPPPPPPRSWRAAVFILGLWLQGAPHHVARDHDDKGSRQAKAARPVSQRE